MMNLRNKAYGPLDLSKYDFVLFLALGAKNEGLSCGEVERVGNL